MLIQNHDSNYIEKYPKKREMPVKWKIFLYFTLFSVLTLSVLWIFQVAFLDDVYKFIKTAEIKTAAHNMTENIDSENFVEICEKTSLRNEVCIRVFRMIDKDNAIEILSLDAVSGCMSHNMNRHGVFKLFDSAVERGGKYIQYFKYNEKLKTYYSVSDSGHNAFMSDDEESIIYTLTTRNSSGEDMLIILNSVISPVGATVKTLNFLLVLISGLLIAISLLFAFIVSRRISKPISKINSSAKLLAQGQYDVDFSHGGYSEISELADTLTYAASELSKVENLRRELIANVSHDLRTPLTLITGYGEVIRDIPGENTPENVQVIIDEANRLTSLVNDMMDISKLQSGHEKVRFEPVNLTASIRETVERYNVLLGVKGYNITFSYDEEITVVTDENRYLQAFCNLLKNAVTYTGEDMTVCVYQNVMTDQSGRRYVRISVCDSGEGIDKSQLPLIWDRYYKVDKSHKRAAVGTGLGLSIVRSVMDMLGGTYGVISEIGNGSTFWLQLSIDDKTKSENFRN